MSFRSGNVVVIADEPDGICDGCGKKDDVRPYGPGYTNVCFDCGMKDPEGVRRRMGHKLFGDPDSEGAGSAP